MNKIGNNSERALTARSVIASTLLGVHPPRLPTRVLVGSGRLFGIADGTTRVAISRMVAAGELVPDGDGHRLGGPLLERQVRQEASRLGATAPWSGRWRTAIVVGDARAAAARSELRRAMAALRLAELREGVWLRPDNLAASGSPEAEAVATAQCRWLTSTPDDGAALAAELWDLPGWASRAGELDERLRHLEDPLAGGDPEALPAGFVLSAAVLRHLQADPLLPASLLPADWPGPALRERYEHYDAAFKGALRAWHRTHLD
ncbi:MAG: PaaX protein C-domain protein [Acidimicrobiales bacterium]|nr:PaaX protein C-domain protein [Acidimicrobiales bacterium]